MRWPNIFETRENRFNINSGYYRDKIDPIGNYQMWGSIQSYRVTNNLEIFVKFHKGLDDNLTEDKIKDALDNIPERNLDEWHTSAYQRDSVYNAFLNKCIRTYINGKYQGYLDWTMEYQSGTNILGLSTTIDISKLEDKKHFLYFGKIASENDRIERPLKINSDGYLVYSFIAFKKVKSKPCK